MTNSTHTTDTMTRVQAIQRLTELDREKDNSSLYKGKRLNTLLGFIAEKEEALAKEKADKEILDDMVHTPTSEEVTEMGGDELYEEITVEKVEKVAKPIKLKKIAVADQTPLEVMERLTVMQRIILTKIVEFNKKEGSAFAHMVIPADDKKMAFQIGGVITTLIQKGVIFRATDKKAFYLTENFQFLLEA